MESKSDVLVIGGGAIGICSAYYLWKSGLKVTVIERDEIGQACSLHNAGYIAPSHIIALAAPGMIVKGLKWMFNPESPFYIKPRFDADLLSWVLKYFLASNGKQMRRSMPVLAELNLASFDLFRQLADLDGVDFEFQHRGLFMLYDTEIGRRDNLHMAALANEVGVNTEIMTGDQINETEPDFRTRALGGVFYPQDAHITPAKFTTGIADYLKGQGVTIVTSTEVIGFEVSPEGISGVRTTSGVYRAREYVLAAGSWSRIMLKGLDVNIPLQPGKGFSVTFTKPKRKPNIPAILTECRVAVTPMGDTLRFGGTLELAGLDLSVNLRRVNAILKAIPRYYIDFDPIAQERTEPWAGMRPCSPDGLPYVGRFGSVKNLIAATGHAMLGISLAPITGKLVSEVVNEEKPSIGIAPLSPDRYR